MVLDQGPNLPKELVYLPSPDKPDVFDEVVLYAQGYLVKANLPPIYSISRLVA